MKILLTGSQGFIGAYICNELLENGHEVIGVDNFSKYGALKRAHDNHTNFKLFKRDILKEGIHDICSVEKPDQIIAGAAMIGGITYFHKFAYDLLATNERILAETFDAAIKGYKDGYLKRIVVLSSSMVFEETEIYPTPEDQVKKCPPPSSTYGFQKLASEYFAKGAYEQYGLPYTIIRPFNCVGVGEEDSVSEEEVMSGNIKLMMSHVLPDLINKCLKGQKPLKILGEGNQVRCYTNGKDLARGIRVAMESEKAINEDFNISTPVATSVLELAEMIWESVNPFEDFEYESDEPFTYDVQKILNFETEISLVESVLEVLEYMKEKEYAK